MRSALFLGTFFIGISAASASSELDAGSGAPPEELQRLAEESGDGGNQLDSLNALEKLHEAQRASQAFANRNFQENEIGNGILPQNGDAWEDESVDSIEDAEGRGLGKKTDFLAPLPPPKKVVVQVPAKKTTPVAVYRKLQVDSIGTSGDPAEDNHELQNGLGQRNTDDDQADERNVSDESEDHISEGNEVEEAANDGNLDSAPESAEANDLDDANGADGIDGLVTDMSFEITDFQAPEDESDGPVDEESEEQRSLGKKRYYYAVPKKAQPPPKKVAVAPKKTPPVKAPMKVHEKKYVPPPKKVHQKKTVAPKKVVRPAKKYVPVQKKAPPPKKVYAPPPKKVYAPPKKAYAPPPKKVYETKKYVPVSKKGGY
ncbi:conserved hypothetical protein [Neospora caninum Liverpool]|uniref:Uncharacterized protein n=1 Tax=Neospora caninum (strain Liverpool) TaxID=572307 RepID=F0VEZ2_NEOCL|nr:conserved hypothetical protein [Neospora caninum Liverpool]CBZ52286.1 conserved hypothetical protein [Neospora caninum Liverpool]CEL66254.1 TPA: hypothetical protein BN1204_020730 [Neospora caninum Liverpool]|eukprot:XP_003882318.1 conserved hypothetical protein [Neospora caninum Liverpool]